jgi:hypothetical protein
MINIFVQYIVEGHLPFQLEICYCIHTRIPMFLPLSARTCALHYESFPTYSRLTATKSLLLHQQTCCWSIPTCLTLQLHTLVEDVGRRSNLYFSIDVVGSVRCMNNLVCASFPSKSYSETTIYMRPTYICSGTFVRSGDD